MLYTVFIYNVEGVFERLPEAEQEAVLVKHRQVQAELKARGAYYGSARLMPSSTAMSVADRGNGVVVTDGPFAETKEQLAGIYLFEADSMEDALEITKMLPLGVAQMEVRPVNWSDNFEKIT